MPRRSSDASIAVVAGCAAGQGGRRGASLLSQRLQQFAIDAFHAVEGSRSLLATAPSLIVAELMAHPHHLRR